MNLKAWIGSKKTKNALMGVVSILIVVGMLLAASGGDSEKFGALLQMVWPYVLGMLSLLGITNLGQSHVDAKIAEAVLTNPGMKKK